MSDSHDQSGEHGKKHAHKRGGHGHGHGGGGHEEGHEGAPEWLISFADMVMLMMGFFVILFALNVNPTGRSPGGMSEETDERGSGQKDEHMLDLVLSIREAFNNPVSLTSTDPKDQRLIRRLLEKAGKANVNDPGVSGQDDRVQSIRPSDYYAFSGSVPFADGSSELTADGARVAGEIVGKVKGLALIIEVRGHASAAESRRGPEVAMRLASERALTVARELARHGVDWWQMRLVIAGDNDRLESFPRDVEGDRLNARADVVVTNEVMPDKAPRGASGR